VTSLASVLLGNHVESIVKVMALVVDFVTSCDYNQINDGQTRGHTISQECVCVCVERKTYLTTDKTYEPFE